MPVFNTGQYVGEAVQSILDQTFTDLELVIVNDGSTDNSLEVIRSFKDRRIRVINNVSNSGHYVARNKGMGAAKGKYICVMDSDDISTLNRLEKQFIYMEENPEIGLSGGGFRILGREEDIFFRETEYGKIKVLLLRGFCFYHTPLIYRKSLLDKHDLSYNENYRLASDYDFVVRCSRHFPVTNIPEDLFHYRIHDDQFSWKFRPEQVAVMNKVRLMQLPFIGIEPDMLEAELHLNLLNKIPIKYSFSGNVHSWIHRVLTANLQKKYYDTEILGQFFDALLSEQPFLNTGSQKSLDFTRFRKAKHKIDLDDATVFLFARIHSKRQIKNLNAVIKHIIDNFNTRIRIIEADSCRKYFPDLNPDLVQYEFIKDDFPVLRKNFLLQTLVRSVDTRFLSVWDTNTVVPVSQVIRSMEQLRSGEVILSFPYDGRIYACDDLISEIFRQTLVTNILQDHSKAFSLYDGWHSCGSVFFALKETYIKINGNNDKILNQKIADEERIKRMEVLGLPFSKVKGPAFRLWNPGLIGYALHGNEAEINDRKILLKTCSEIQL